MPNPFNATRYHSLVIGRERLPPCLEITADTDSMNPRMVRTSAEAFQKVPGRAPFQ